MFERAWGKARSLFPDLRLPGSGMMAPTSPRSPRSPRANAFQRVIDVNGFRRLLREEFLTPPSIMDIAKRVFR